eukprot:CAMPEP_0195520712 /NCGR_PEP_ID=MMETSP0794_2-20130614/17479_1 /TAXON_ID=515487 /ORGANISM="Stephanopyxis turris, Strain CCMP 815" /LENGTH=102 /DNA_ID=CAMNT_0040650131 /DNA_START=222 /DNA_END=530 /DNA_ORIENTATION=-
MHKCPPHLIGTSSSCLFEKSSSDEQSTPTLSSLKGEKEEDELTAVGSKEYYKGFVSRSLEEDSERGDGLEQALKLGGQATIVLALLVAVFVVSNLNTPPPNF